MSYQVAKSRSTTENSRHSLSTYFVLNTALCTWQSQMTVPGGSAGKESTCNVGDLGSIPGLGRSPGEGKGYPLQYPGMENSMRCIVHGVSESRTRLSDFHLTSLCYVPGTVPGTGARPDDDAKSGPAKINGSQHTSV